MTDKQQPPERIWIDTTPHLLRNLYVRGYGNCQLAQVDLDHIEYARVHPDDARVEEIRTAIADMKEGRASHQQWLDHLLNPTREACKGCDDHAAHIGDIEHHRQWIARYDRAIRLLSLLPQLSSSETGQRCTCGHRCPTKYEREVEDAQCEHAPDCELMREVVAAPAESSERRCGRCGHEKRWCFDAGFESCGCKCVFPATEAANDLVSREAAMRAVCSRCANPDRYGPPVPVEGSQRLFHFQIADNWNAGQCDAQAIRELPSAATGAGEGERREVIEAARAWRFCDDKPVERFDFPEDQRLARAVDALNAASPVSVAEGEPPESDGWVTFGRVKVDIENETETFERIHPPAPTTAPVVEAPKDERCCPHPASGYYKVCNNCWLAMPWREDGREFQHKPYPYTCGEHNEKLVIVTSAATPGEAAGALPLDREKLLASWPLTDVLSQLAVWAEHLHDDHDCDCHGWEARSFLIPAAKIYATSRPTTDRVE